MDKSLIERIERCNQLNCKEHKDLFWLLSSDSISKKLMAKNHFELIKFSDLDTLFQNLLNNSSPQIYNPNLRLGKYVEKLISYYLNQYSSFELLESQIQLIKDKKTIGEIDFLLKSGQEMIHLEFAIKYYIEINSPITEYWGPNFNDNWLRKREHLVSHQMALSSKFNHLLPSQYRNQSFSQCVSILGNLFYGIDKNINCWYCLSNNLEEIKNKGSYFKLVERRLDWAFPFETPDYYLDYEELNLKLKELDDTAKMIVIYTHKKIPNSWGFLLKKNSLKKVLTSNFD